MIKLTTNVNFKDKIEQKKNLKTSSFKKQKRYENDNLFKLKRFNLDLNKVFLQTMQVG
jgi:hypothetical protein